MAKSTARKPGTKAKPAPGLMHRIESAFRAKFPTDTVDVSRGYKDNVHVLVVSRQFDGLSERAKYALLWKIIEHAGLSDPEKDRVSVLLGLSPAEIK
jgi:hypothetical protein